MILVLDESGDLGFDFSKSRTSRHFVIAVLLLNSHADATLIRRAVERTLRHKVHGKRKPSEHLVSELKGTRTPPSVKRYYWTCVADVDFSLYAIILNKQRVNGALRRVPKRLYNYLARQLIDHLPLEGVQDLTVTIDRSKSRPEIENFNKYVSMHLQGTLDPRAVLRINHVDSQQDKAIQAVDLFSWGIFRKYEREDEAWYQVFQSKIVYETVFLPGATKK